MSIHISFLICAYVEKLKAVLCVGLISATLRWPCAE